MRWARWTPSSISWRVAVCLDNLNITRAVVPVLCEGSGFVRCQHGMIPVPVPAVANIAGANGLKLKLTEIQGELVTPTGAAHCGCGEDG